MNKKAIWNNTISKFFVVTMIMILALGMTTSVFGDGEETGREAPTCCQDQITSWADLVPGESYGQSIVTSTVYEHLGDHPNTEDSEVLSDVWKDQSGIEFTQPIRGATFDVTLHLWIGIITSPGWNEYINVWVDWNGDGDFEDVNEQIIDHYDYYTPGPHDLIFSNIPVPADAVSQTYLRAEIGWNHDPESVDSWTWGDVEDYAFAIPSFCGNDILEEGEECDNGDWGNINECSDFEEYNWGDLTCTPDCTFDTSDCIYDVVAPLVEVITPPDSNPITWYAGIILTEATVSDPLPSSGLDYVNVGYHDILHNWDEGYFGMAYNPGTGFFEYDWDTTQHALCSIVQVDVFGYDNVGNEGGDTNQFGIDNEPPVTTKDWTIPYVECGCDPSCDLYVTPDTLFTLSAYEDCGAGVDETYYSINGSAFQEYAGPFSLQPGCGQTIEYYSTDLVGNVEDTHLEIDHVDDLPPTTEKTFDGPTVDLVDEDNYYVTMATIITLTAEDHSPDSDDCPVGVDYIHYEIWWDSDDDGVVDTLMTKLNVTENPVSFSFMEESIHEIRWYAVDLLGNVETEHVQEHAVDDTAPTLDKTVGEPKVPYGEGDWYVNQSTPITLTCVDPVPHPVDNVTIYWYWTWDDGTNSGQSDDFSYNGVEVTFSFTEDSWHTLYYWCEDALENTVSYVEYDIVDTAAPETAYEVIGPVYYDELEDKLYVDGISQIELVCNDVEPHPVGGDYITYRYYVDDVLVQPWINYTVPFSFPEESHHILEYYCVDLLGNKEADQSAEFYVDHTKPITDLTFGTPYYTDDISEWINSLTLITLTADDGSENHDSGVDETYYRWEQVGDSNCTVECLAAGSGEWSTYDVPFTIDEDSCHLIEYYSVDNVDKTEDIKKKCVYVDNQEPITTKTVGDPQLSGIGIADLIIANYTEITFSCVDPAPHPVDEVTIYWKWRYSVDGYTWGGWSADITYDGTAITFDESSFHELEYWCVDKLGNEEVHQSEIDGVDADAPTTTKTLGTPQYDDGTYMWISQNTEITLECDDGQLHPSGVDKIYYRYDVDETGWTNWINYSEPFTFNEDSNHTLQYYCVDNFGNEETVQEEFDKVDTAGPEIVKWVEADPYMQPNETIRVCANITDLKMTGDSGVGVDYATVRLELGDDPLGYDMHLVEGDTYCTDNFTFEDCGRWHVYVEAYDLLENYNEEDGIEIVIDGVPPVAMVLTPHAGNQYYDGKIFPVYAPAVDFGGDDCYNPDDCPASGVDYCTFFALDFCWECVNQSEIKSCLDVFEYLDQTVGEYTKVEIGTVPYVDGVCQGYLQIPEDSGLTDTVFMGIKVVDNAGNYINMLGWDGYLAMNPWISPITMDMEEIGDLAIIDINGLVGPVTSGDAVSVTVEITNSSLTGTLTCVGKIYLYEEDIPEDIGIPEFESTALWVEDHFECNPGTTIPYYIAGYGDLQSGDYMFEVTLIHDSFNLGSDSIDFVLDNDRPYMGVVSPHEDEVYGAMLPVSLNVEDMSAVVDETVKFQIREIAWWGNLWCFGGCEGTPWLLLPEQANGLYADTVNLSLYNITGESRYTFDAIACDILYDPTDLDEEGNPVIAGNDRNGHHCRKISIHGAIPEDRPECNDGWDNDWDDYIDYDDDDGCYGYDDDDEMAFCGNGYEEEDEVCDDGEDNGLYGDYCNANCTGYTGYCGDGVIDYPDEECEFDTDCEEGEVCDGCSCTSEPD